MTSQLEQVCCPYYERCGNSYCYHSSLHSESVQCVTDCKGDLGPTVDLSGCLSAFKYYVRKASRESSRWMKEKSNG